MIVIGPQTQGVPLMGKYSSDFDSPHCSTERNQDCYFYFIGRKPKAPRDSRICTGMRFY